MSSQRCDARRRRGPTPAVGAGQPRGREAVGAAIQSRTEAAPSACRRRVTKDHRRHVSCAKRTPRRFRLVSRTVVDRSLVPTRDVVARLGGRHSRCGSASTQWGICTDAAAADPVVGRRAAVHAVVGRQACGLLSGRDESSVRRFVIWRWLFLIAAAFLVPKPSRTPLQESRPRRPRSVRRSPLASMFHARRSVVDTGSSRRR